MLFVCFKQFVIAVDVCKGIYKRLQMNAAFLTKFDNLSLILETSVIAEIGEVFFTFLRDWY